VVVVDVRVVLVVVSCNICHALPRGPCACRSFALRTCHALLRGPLTHKLDSSLYVPVDDSGVVALVVGGSGDDVVLLDVVAVVVIVVVVALQWCSCTRAPIKALC